MMYVCFVVSTFYFMQQTHSADSDPHGPAPSHRLRRLRRQVCDDYSVQLWLAAMGLDVSNAVTW